MVVFVLNCGSSSLKFQLYQMPDEAILAKGKALKNDSGNAEAEITFKLGGKNFNIKGFNVESIIEKILFEFTNPENKCLDSWDEIQIIGHRLIHGGEKAHDCARIDADLIEFMEKSIPLAPLHYPPNIEGIKTTIKFLPNAFQSGVFDTAFHHTIPEKAFLYGLPYNWYSEHKIRRYGFHGTSHKYVSQTASELSGISISKSKIISCHLGSGASVAAIKNGISVDTSMGFTPAEGLLMGTRCGDLDTGVLLFIQRNFNLSVDEMDELLNNKGGLLGLSGVSSDFPKVLESANSGNKQAAVALEVFAYRIKKYIGSYAAAMGGLDILIFTGGIGENSAEIRSIICDELDFLGIRICNEKNLKCTENELINIKESKVKIAVVKTCEELAIAREVFQFVNHK